jgi:hypothetical protein
MLFYFIAHLFPSRSFALLLTSLTKSLVPATRMGKFNQGPANSLISESPEAREDLRLEQREDVREHLR